MHYIFVDGMNLVYRSHFKAGKDLSHKGKPTGVLFGFMSALRTIIATYPDTILAVVWDAPPYADLLQGRGRASWRKQMFPDYKANRHDSEDRRVALQQVPALYKALDILRIPQLGRDGVEADDLIASCVFRLTGASDATVSIYSNDEDFYQLISHRVFVVNSSRKEKNGVGIIGPREVQAKLGIPPSKVPEYKALVGDSTDNYKGVPKVGPVTALEMLRDGMDPALPFHAHPRGVQKKYEVYREHWPAAQLCLELATMKVYQLSPAEYEAISTKRYFIKGIDGAIQEFGAWLSGYGMAFLYERRFQFFR